MFAIPIDPFHTKAFLVNGDIAQEFVNYWVTSGDTQFFEDSLFPVYNSIATFYSEILTKNGSTYQLTNMTDPDEVFSRYPSTRRQADIYSTPTMWIMVVLLNH